MCLAALTTPALCQDDCDDGAAKGQLCNDEPCAPGLTCAEPSGSVSRVLRFCARTGLPEGALCSVGRLDTASIAPQGTWTPVAFQTDLIAYTVRTDFCAEGLACFDGRCSSTAERDGFTSVAAEESAKYVTIGAACDGVNSLCPARNFGWMAGLRLVREVPAACIDGVCVSTDAEYPVGGSCGAGCGRLACGSAGRCVDDDPDPFDAFPTEGAGSLPRYGEACPLGRCFWGDRGRGLCIGGVCVASQDLDGQGFDEDCDDVACAEGLTCENLYSRPDENGLPENLRCALESLPEGASCKLIEFPKAWDRLNALQCQAGLSCDFVSGKQGSKCLRTVQRREICGLDRGIVCSEGNQCVDDVCS